MLEIEEVFNRVGEKGTYEWGQPHTFCYHNVRDDEWETVKEWMCDNREHYNGILSCYSTTVCIHKHRLRLPRKNNTRICSNYNQLTFVGL